MVWPFGLGPKGSRWFSFSLFPLVLITKMLADEKWRTAHGSQVSGDKMRKWYNGGQLFDDEIREKYGKLVEKMSDENDHDYDHWQETPLGVVAAVIVLDQFTRNIYRKTPKGLRIEHRFFFWRGVLNSILQLSQQIPKHYE